MPSSRSRPMPRPAVARVARRPRWQARRLRRVLGLAAVLVSVLLAAVGVLAAGAQGRLNGPDAGRAYVLVSPGDTLWDIAAARAPRGIDLRYAVYRLREHNQLSSASLRVGQRIFLPPGWRTD